MTKPRKPARVGQFERAEILMFFLATKLSIGLPDASHLYHKFRADYWDGDDRVTPDDGGFLPNGHPLVLNAYSHWYATGKLRRQPAVISRAGRKAELASKIAAHLNHPR